ncbi:hypothetical protein Pcinc_018451 [Petrolisthes cinctipes]|uniref:Thiamin pyrophosphokinase thiamin-binding domain-containing protein n=1 Tax=Petrolisthes cinctipes TaxID=88211 RepID=A0AAE1FM71_PETCI|nr:hypothetical protein Pcinc_018451 [Petrolisthes cinctipes]
MQTYNVALTHNEPLSSSNTEVNDILPPSASCPYPSSPLPDLISGDFDSIHPELLKLYESLGVTIVPTPDQNETDFTKAVKVLARYIEEREIKIGHVLVVTGIHSDRFDHVMANLATLYKVRSIIKTPVILLSGGSMVWVLEEGKHRVEVSWQLIKNPNVSWCGLIPLGHPATVSTTGLKWNLADQMLEFGTLVSTSNTYDPTHHGQIYITTSHPCLWTMGWETRGTDVEMDG